MKGSVKSFLAVLVAIAMLAPLSAFASQPVSTVRTPIVTLSQSALDRGDTLTVYVALNSSVSLDTMQYTLSYDKDVFDIDVTEVEEIQSFINPLWYDTYSSQNYYNFSMTLMNGIKDAGEIKFSAMRMGGVRRDFVQYGHQVYYGVYDLVVKDTAPSGSTDITLINGITTDAITSAVSASAVSLQAISPVSVSISDEEPLSAPMQPDVCITFDPSSGAFLMDGLEVEAYNQSARSFDVSTYSMGSPYDYLYDDLYNVIKDGIENMDTTIDITSVSPPGIPFYGGILFIETVLYAVFDDHPEMFYVFIEGCRGNYIDGVLYVMSIDLEYLYPETITAEDLEEFDFAAKSIISQTIYPGMTDREKALSVHEYLVANCSQPLSSDNMLRNTSYGPIVTGRASSYGYASAFKLLMDYAGVECNITHFYMDGEQVNRVKIDGDWYNVDVYYNDINSTHSLFLVSDEKLASERALENPHSDITCTNEQYESGYFFNDTAANFWYDGGYFWKKSGSDYYRHTFDSPQSTLAAYTPPTGIQIYDPHYCNQDKTMSFSELNNLGHSYLVIKNHSGTTVSGDVYLAYYNSSDVMLGIKKNNASFTPANTLKVLKFNNDLPAGASYAKVIMFNDNLMPLYNRIDF